MNKAEIALMGYVVEINTNEEAIDVLDEIAELLEEDFSGVKIFKEATKYCNGAEIEYLSVNIISDMLLIALPMTTDEDTEPFDILSKYGAFGYVYNATAPDCSELGYSYYENRNNEIVRVG